MNLRRKITPRAISGSTLSLLLQSNRLERWQHNLPPPRDKGRWKMETIRIGVLALPIFLMVIQGLMLTAIEYCSENIWKGRIFRSDTRDLFSRLHGMQIFSWLLLITLWLTSFPASLVLISNETMRDIAYYPEPWFFCFLQIAVSFAGIVLCMRYAKLVSKAWQSQRSHD